MSELVRDRGGRPVGRESVAGSGLGPFSAEQVGWRVRVFLKHKGKLQPK